MSTKIYNGVELPDYPNDCDLTLFQYAILSGGSSGTDYQLILSQKPIIYSNNFCTVYPEHRDYILGDNGWTLFDNSTSTGSVYGAYVFWANHDICDRSETVYLAGSDPTDPSVVTNISIYSPTTVARGFHISPYAKVTGEGEFDISYTMTMSGASGTGTKLVESNLDSDGDGVIDYYAYMLYCDAAETAETLTLTATSTADPTITATVTIAVEDLEPGLSGGGDSGDSGGDSGDSGGDSGGGSEGITPEEKRAIWWSGFATGVALYSHKL